MENFEQLKENYRVAKEAKDKLWKARQAAQKAYNQASEGLDYLEAELVIEWLNTHQGLTYSINDPINGRQKVGSVQITKIGTWSNGSVHIYSTDGTDNYHCPASWYRLKGKKLIDWILD